MFETILLLPTPWQILTDPASIIIISIFLILVIAEILIPARKLPTVRFWKIKGIVAFFLYFFISSYLPFFWNNFLAEYRIFDLTFLGNYWGGFTALLFYELAVYFWHLSMHKSHLLWRVFHQMHHSAERVDTYGAFYFSLMDMIGFSFLTSFALVWIAGFTAQATLHAIYGATFLAVIQHTNIKTPRWTGYIFQRPESHSLHHEKGIHAFNYSDLPLFDIIFRTFRNPNEFSKEAGFYNGASSKIGQMLLFKNINTETNKIANN